MTKKCFNKALGLINFEGVHLASLNDIFLFCFVILGGGSQAIHYSYLPGTIIQ